MRYITIGSGSAVPQRERSAPCHLVVDGDRIITVDLGPGSIWGLLRHGNVSLREIGLVLLTHLHMDHCADLAPLLFALRSRDLSRTQPLVILGPRGLRDHYGRLRTTWEHRVDPSGFELVIDEWAGHPFQWKGLTVCAAPTSHSVQNMAWRIDPGPDGACGIVITGDGQSTEELVTMAGAAQHVLVAECAAGSGQVVEGHMNPAQAAELARECGASKLVLSHINPGARPEAILIEAASRFDGEVIIAEDGMEMEIG